MGILGLAIYQSVNQKVYKDLKEAITNMVKVKAVYKPDAGRHAVYKKRFAEFMEIIKLIDK